MTPNLLDRYLAEIARNLPAKAQRDDIVAEISDDIQSRIEAGEGSEYDVIKAYGHPKIVAARYGQQQYLINPTVLPFYWYTLRLALSIVLGVEIFGTALAAFVLHNFGIFTTGLSTIWPTLLGVIGAVTLAFALVERFGKGAFVKWDPSALPAPSTKPVSRFDSGFEFIANFTMLTVVLFAGPWLAKTISPLALTPAWQSVWYATIVGTAIVCGTAFAVYLTPAWTKLRYINGIVSQCIMIVGCVFTLLGGVLVTQTAQTISTLDLGVINMMVQWSIGIVIVTMLCSIAYNVWRLMHFTARTGSQPGGNGHILSA